MSERGGRTIMPWGIVVALLVGWSFDVASRADEDTSGRPDIVAMVQDGPAERGWSGYELQALRTQRAATDRPYLPFLTVPSLRMGLYSLEAGSTDGQRPHEFDETYYVVKGSARIQAGEDRWAVKEGSIVYVKREIEHRFFDITEDLEVLVFFPTAKPDAVDGP